MNNTNETTTTEIGIFGPIYRQFEKKPKEAIKYLRKMKTGECQKKLKATEIIRGSLYEFVKTVIADKITRLHCMAKRCIFVGTFRTYDVEYFTFGPLHQTTDAKIQQIF